MCQAGVRKFNELASGLDNTEIIGVSQDLPFAVANFCATEGLDDVLVGSAFRSGFGTDYGITMADGKWRGLLARAVVVLDDRRHRAAHRAHLRHQRRAGLRRRHRRPRLTHNVIRIVGSSPRFV